MTISFNLKIKADTKTILNAITTKKGFQGWWAKVCDVDCGLGQMSSIRFEKENLTEDMRFKTIIVKENKQLVWLCTANNVFESWVGTTLDFTIKEEKGHCEFIFTQISNDKPWKKNSDYNGSVAGWDFFFKSLKAYCESGQGMPWG